MDTTFDNNLDNLRNGKQRLKTDLGDGAREVKNTMTGEYKNFVADVEDVVKKVANVSDADVARVRTKIQDALASAKDGITSSANTIKTQAKQVADNTDTYVRTSPWQAIGIAALVGISIGFIASRRS